jgi:hypothetical protein
MKLARYSEMKERGFFSNRMTERRLVVDHGYPPPYQIAPNILAWDVDEWEAHVASRPRRLPSKEAAQVEREAV